MRLEGDVERLERGDTHLALRRVHVGQELIDRLVNLTRTVVERRADIGDRLGEEALPGRHDGLALGEHALLIVGQDVRAEASLRDEVMPIAGHLRRVDQRQRHRIVERDPLEVEEAQRVLGAHHSLVHDGLEVTRLVIVDVDAAA